MQASTTKFDVYLGGIGFMLDWESFDEELAGQFIQRQAYQSEVGELDFAPSWPYHQRSFILGEQQYHAHEADELRNTATRRYQEGHGVDGGVDGELTLLPALARSLATAADPTTCPMCVSRDGTTVYAFPAGAILMQKYTAAGGWTSETVTGATAPIVDCVNAGDEVYVVDSAASGSRVLKRSSGGTWTRVNPPSQGTTVLGLNVAQASADTMALNEKACTRFTVPAGETWDVTAINVYVDGGGSGAGSQVAKASLYSCAPNGMPRDRLVISSEITVTDGQAAGWVSCGVTSGTCILAGGENGRDYMIALHAGSNTNTIRWYYAATGGKSYSSTSDTYADGSEAVWSGGTLGTLAYSAFVSATAWTGDWPPNAYDTATAVAWTNGELLVLTPTRLYSHNLVEVASDWTGGSIMASFSGAVYFSDGSNRVYLYGGQGTRLILEDLPDDFSVTALFSAHARLWVCGSFSDGDAGIYWYAKGQFGILARLPQVGSGTRQVKGGCGSFEHVIFADSAYGGSSRHYIGEGGWAHHIALGSAQTIPYKGIVHGAGKLFVALATGAAGTQGIYIEQATFVSSGTLTSSQIDLQMPAHQKEWTSIVVETLPLRTTETVMVEVSYDGGRTWAHRGTMRAGESEGLYSLGSPSHTFQYRLTLTAGTGAATAPTVLAVTPRGMPKVAGGSIWKVTLFPNRASPSVSGKQIQDGNTKMTDLAAIARGTRLVSWIDPWGQEHRVGILQIVRRPAFDKLKKKVGSLATVVLQELEA